jgi:hypothetical protein
MQAWLKSGKYLPEFMRDFHDQKLLFKWIGHIIDKGRADPAKRLADMPSWVDAHIYTIDFFLWYMAKCGYTLQKTRTKLEFYNIEATLEDFQKKLNKEYNDEQ